MFSVLSLLWLIYSINPRVLPCGPEPLYVLLVDVTQCRLTDITLSQKKSVRRGTSCLSLKPLVWHFKKIKEIVELGGWYFINGATPSTLKRYWPYLWTKPRHTACWILNKNCGISFYLLCQYAFSQKNTKFWHF